jgi:carbamate kinase
MPHYKLIATAKKRADVIVDEIILARDKVTGEVTSRISTSVAHEIENELLGKAKQEAARFGFAVVEAPEPEEATEAQPVGDDVRGMSPVNVGGAGLPGAQDPAQAPPAPQGTPTPAQTSPGNPGGSGPGIPPGPNQPTTTP